MKIGGQANRRERCAEVLGSSIPLQSSHSGDRERERNVAVCVGDSDSWQFNTLEWLVPWREREVKLNSTIGSET